MMTLKDELQSIVQETNEQVCASIAEAGARIDSLVDLRRDELQRLIARANKALVDPRMSEDQLVRIRATLRDAESEIGAAQFAAENAKGELPYVGKSIREADPSWSLRF